MFISMPLLTELVSIKDGYGYSHGAPTELSPHAGTVFHRSRAQPLHRT
jgi:hypothetical protein